MFINSDHNYIRFYLGSNTEMRRQNLGPATRGWDVSKGIFPGLLEVGLLIAEWLNPAADHSSRDATHITELFEHHVKTACDIALQRKSAPSLASKPVHWWNPELTVLRRHCVSVKRSKTRMVTGLGRLQLGAADLGIAQASAEAAAARLTRCKMAIEIVIARSKKPSWDELLQSVESDPFGNPINW
jgi:hypothetical protein